MSFDSKDKMAAMDEDATGSIHSKDFDNAVGVGDLDGPHDLVEPLSRAAPAEPSWPAFVARLKIEAPELRPDENDDRWKNLHAVYIMGYSACLEILKDELKAQPNE